MSELTEDPKTYFAAERTFLAWIRTGLGLMGVGFAIARFGLFLRQMYSEQPHSADNAAIHSTGLSVYAGVAMVTLGIAVNLGAVTHHIRTIRELRSGTWTPGRFSWSAIVLSLVLALFGIGIALYLLLLR
jgi:putative membrane protein